MIARLSGLVLPACSLLACSLAACSVALAPEPDHAERTETIAVVVRGWHTDIGLPASALDGRLAPLRDVFPGSAWLVFGIGERSFLVKPDAGLVDMLTALLPNPSAMLVTGLNQSPEHAFAAVGETTLLPVSRGGLDRLVAFIESSFEYDGPAGPRLLSYGPYPGSLFYYATPTYSGLYTCNTWTADALGVAGLPVRASGTLFASDIARQIGSPAKSAGARSAGARSAGGPPRDSQPIHQ